MFSFFLCLCEARGSKLSLRICSIVGWSFFERNKSLMGFVKCTSCVKYASRVKCATAREGIYFISLAIPPIL